MAAKIGEYRAPSAQQQSLYRLGADLSLTTTNGFPGLVIDEERGGGAVLYDVDGNEYLDFGFPGTDNFGFGSSLRFVKARIEKLKVCMLPEHDVHTKLGIAAKAELVRRTPVRALVSGSGKSAGVASGSDANEWAMDLARQRDRGREVFACFWGAFHGRNHGIRAALDPRRKERVEGYWWPYPFLRFRFPSRTHPDPVALVEEDFDALIRPRVERVNAFFMELVQVEGGVSVANQAAIRRLVELCQSNDILVVIDEVQTGMGRSGTLWSYEQYGFLPDIVTAGKALSGGIAPTAAIVARVDLDFTKPGQRSSTFGIEPVRAAAMLGAFEALDCGLLERVSALGVYLKDRFAQALGKHRFVREIQGLGLMAGIEFWHGKDDPRPFPELRDKLRERLQASGVLTLGCGLPQLNPGIRILPPFVMTRREIAQAAEIFARELSWLEKNASLT